MTTPSGDCMFEDEISSRHLNATKSEVFARGGRVQWGFSVVWWLQDVILLRDACNVISYRYFDIKVETHLPKTFRKKVYLERKIDVASSFCASSWRNTRAVICPSCCPPPSSSLFPPYLLPILYPSAIRQIVASLICIVSTAIPTGAPRSCSLKDSGASAPSHSPISWIKLTLGQHQHIMNYGHLPLQTHCSLCSNVGNVEGPGRLNLLIAYSLSYLLWGARASESGW